MRSYARINRRLAKQYDRWMVAMHYVKHTQRIHRKTIQQYLKFMGKRSVAAANHISIRNFIARISEDGASLNTVYRALGVLRLFYDFLNLGGVVSYVPPRFLRLRRPWLIGPRALTESQVRRVLSAARTQRERALVEFLYATGCRLGETLRLKIEELDLDNRTARIRGKLRKVRTVLLTHSAAEALRTYIAGRKRGFVFRQDLPVAKGCLTRVDGKWTSMWSEYKGPNRIRSRKHKYHGMVDQLPYAVARKKHDAFIARLRLRRRLRNAPLAKLTVQTIVRQIGRRAGLKGITPHVFRRTFATHLYNRGAGVEIIKALMGHVWIHSTLRYVQIGSDRLAKTFDQCHPLEELNAETKT